MTTRYAFSLKLLIAAMFAVAAGCNGKKEAKIAPGAPNSEQTKPEVSLKILDFDGIQELIASHKGKVVVMDCWSTSCAPCIKEFPKLVALHKEHGPETLACISLSFDYEGVEGTRPEDSKPAVLKFLESKQATFDNVLCSEDSDTLRGKMELSAIPAVYVYNREGKLEQLFEGEGAYENVPALVEKLRAK